MPGDVPTVRLTLRLLRALPVGRGVWCPACLLPSGVVLELLVELPGPDGQRGRVWYSTEARCHDCYREIPRFG